MSERGAMAGLEGLLFGVLILLGGLTLIVNAWSVVDSKMTLDSASREFVRAYTDQNNPTTVVGGPSFYGRVGAYTLVDLSATTKIGKNFTLTAGVNNLFDTDPPFSNQSTRSQRGYDPRYTDPLGRALFVRGAVSF